MIYILGLVQLIISIILILMTVVQSKGQGLSSSFSGSISFYRSRRGLEKAIFYGTIILGILLIGNSVALTLLR